MKIIPPFYQRTQSLDESLEKSKPKLALIHGWGLHGGIWETLISKLESQYQVYNIDLPGFGRSPIANGDYNLEYLVESVVSVLPEKCHIIGWSMGGLVATATALKYPERIDKLVTVASSPCFVETERNPHGMNKTILDTFIQYLSEDFRGTLIKFLSIQTMGSKTQKADIQRLKETVFLHGVPAEKALAGGLSILKNTDLSEQLNDLKMPLLRIYGKLDTLVPRRSISYVDKLVPSSEKIIFSKSGHSPFLSQTFEFIDSVSKFTKANH
ncbi:MAG: pimeloyl-ACP methyl ester esterase BioH [Kangiellaceae bacterium]